MKRRALIITTVLTCIVAFVPTARRAGAHKFYTSLAQVEYNEESKTVEVSLRIFADDLELALSRRTGRPVKLERAKESEPLALDYLRETFILKNRAGETKPLRLVGMEVQREAAWLYVEAEMPEGLEGARLLDRVLFEVYAKQVNVVDFKWKGGRSDLVFQRGDGEREVPPRRR